MSHTTFVLPVGTEVIPVLMHHSNEFPRLKNHPILASTIEILTEPFPLDFTRCSSGTEEGTMLYEFEEPIDGYSGFIYWEKSAVLKRRWD